MKNYCAFRLALVAAVLVWASGLVSCAAAQDPGHKVIDPKQLRLTITAGSVFLNGHELKPPVTPQEIINLIGKPNRTSSRAWWQPESRFSRTILTWDEFGIYVYVDRESETVLTISVAFREEPFRFVPERVFTGHISIDTVEVTADSTAEQLDAAIHAQKELYISTHRDKDKRLLVLSIRLLVLSSAPGFRINGLPSTSAKDATAAGLHTRPQMAPGADPLSQLVGEWDLQGFLIGGGGSGFSGLTFGTVSVAPPSDRTVSISASSEDDGDYLLRLTHSPEMNAYLITVKSKHGISVDNFPMTYVDGKGWRGTLDQLVDGEMLSTTARVTPIEGRNWYGWTIEVLPTAATKLLKLQDVEKPYFKADLTRRK